FCFGTTLKKAGGIKEFIEIEKHISEKILLMAKRGRVKSIFLVSAMGANSKSFVLYNKIKGEIEVFAQSLKFESLYIFRPSLLLGERSEKRFFEKIAQKILGPLMLLDQYFPKVMPISTETVVEAMMKLVRHPRSGRHIIENDAMKVLSR
ncbi:MAG: hypothetical protein JNM93_03145, partial [Bacteriovoracaceae bacterium]|nr:hypothetical protein [Bacteriovoracaceae bacterium]